MIGRAVNGYHCAVSTVLKSGSSPPSGAGGKQKPPALFYFDYYYYLYNTKKNRYDTFSIFRSRARHLLADRCAACHRYIQMEDNTFRLVEPFANTFDVSYSSCFCCLQMGTKVCEEVGKRD